MFSGLEEVELERKRETSSTVENKEPFFLYAWRRKNACSFKTRESEFPLLIRFAYLQHREEICLPFTMLSYKGDTLGEHMHAWPQDLTRAEGEGEGLSATQTTRRTDRVSSRSVLSRSDDGEQWLVNFKQVSIV